jgi:hypothetical protein
MNATVITLARWLAEKAVKQEIHARGLKLARFTRAEIAAAAKEHLQHHPELHEQAMEIICKSSELTALAKREELYRNPLATTGSASIEISVELQGSFDVRKPLPFGT